MKSRNVESKTVEGSVAEFGDTKEKPDRLDTAKKQSLQLAKADMDGYHRLFEGVRICADWLIDEETIKRYQKDYDDEDEKPKHKLDLSDK